ncbi:hypothetical protein SUGI_0845140 [Cryptomeria japonica]|nr:hypothetical protein SUGI_0845140 [Cryptomeria japonica]
MKRVIGWLNLSMMKEFDGLGCEDSDDAEPKMDTEDVEVVAATTEGTLHGSHHGLDFARVGPSNTPASSD